MAYIFIIIFISKLVSVEMACLLGIQNEIQAVCMAMSDSNQITVVAFQPVQLAQASFLLKNQTLQNVF